MKNIKLFENFDEIDENSNKAELLYKWDGNFESYQVGELEVSRNTDGYYTSDMKENDLQLDDRKSMKTISKEEYEKLTNSKIK